MPVCPLDSQGRLHKATAPPAPPRSLPTPPPLLPILKRAASIQLAPNLLIFSLRRYGKIPANFWANPVTGTVWSQGRSTQQCTTADPDFAVEFMDVHRGAVRTCQGLPPLFCLAPGLRVSCSGKQGFMLHFSLQVIFPLYILNQLIIL